MAQRFILECINYDEANKPVRTMLGLSMSFDMAHFLMEKFASLYDDILIHPLLSATTLYEKEFS